MIGVEYGRTSKDTDDAYSVSTQIEKISAYADVNNITVPPEYIFREDFTGRALDRPEYSKIRALVKQRKIQAVIVYATDRFARKVSVGEILLDELIENGVQLHIVAWNSMVRNVPEDKLRFNFETTFSGFEREKIYQRTMSAKKTRAARGEFVGNQRPIYGYQLNEYRNNFVPSANAPIAREVLLSYGVEQTNPNDIAIRLEARGVPTPGSLQYDELMAGYRRKLDTGMITPEVFAQKEQFARQRLSQNRWNPNCVYTILHNYKAYAGEFTFQLEGEAFSMQVPPIISKDEALAVERMLALGKRRFSRKAQPVYNFLMNGRLTCGMCEYSYTGAYTIKGYRSYRCGSYRQKKAPRTCTNKLVNAVVLEKLTRQFVRDLLLDPERLFAWWKAQHEQDVAIGQDVEDQIASVDQHIATTQLKLHRTLDRLTDKLDEDELTFYTQQRDSLKQLLSEYREERERLEKSRFVPRVDPETISDYKELGERYRHTLETSEDFTFWRGLVDDLDVTGIIGVDEEKRRYIDFVVFGRIRKREFLGGDGRKKGGSGDGADLVGSWRTRASAR